MLLLKVAEECAEVIQRCGKAIKFGLRETQPNHELNNTQRLQDELWDLIVALKALEQETNENFTVIDIPILEAKRARLEKYFKYSQELGILK